MRLQQVEQQGQGQAGRVLRKVAVVLVDGGSRRGRNVGRRLLWTPLNIREEVNQAVYRLRLLRARHSRARARELTGT